MKLYHYVHCPFCIRIRMALGFLGIQYESIVLPYNDEETPIKLCGKKMLPIMVINKNTLNESLDIISLLDEHQKLALDQAAISNQELQELIQALGKDVHPLAMPYFIWTPEFDENSRNYFQTKKEKTKGPFKELIKNKQVYLDGLNKTLNKLEKNLAPYYQSNSLSLADILIASHLWGMYIVPEFQFSPHIHQYLQQVSKDCHFQYHQDFWDLGHNEVKS